MKIVIAGASGFIGSNLMTVLHRAGHQIVAISRRHGVDVASMRSADDWMPWVEQADAAINAIGIIGETRSQRFDALHTVAPMAYFDACRLAGVKRVIQISALGADDTAFSAYHLSKKAADDHLRSLDLDGFVLRPAMVYGRGGTSAELFKRLARLPVLPVIGDGHQSLQPVHVADVVATVLACLAAQHTRLTLDIVGNETITYIEWLQRLRKAQGRTRARVLPLPIGLVLAGVCLGSPFSKMLRPANIRMLAQCYRADAQAWSDFMGREALHFSPALLAADAAEALAPSGSTS